MTSSTGSHFTEQLRRLRSGDAEAIDAFLAEYEQFIRRSLRFKIRRAALQSVADSVDVCQSVLGSFLLRLSAGEYELQSEEDLRKLLTTIAKRKFLGMARRESAEKRNRGRTVSLSEVADVVDSRIASPAQSLELRELRDAMELKLTPHEQTLVRLRNHGLSWEAIGCQLQEEPVVLRKRLSRAIRRVAFELGLEESDEDKL